MWRMSDGLALRKLGPKLLTCGLLISVMASLTGEEVMSAISKPSPRHLKTAYIPVSASRIASFDKLNASRRTFGALEFIGGLTLKSKAENFGGWSGIALDRDGRRLIAVSDGGTWLTARLDYVDGKPSALSKVRMGPLKALNNSTLRRNRDRDAEAVALVGGTVQRGKLLIAFEQNHRIGRFDISERGLSAPKSYLRPARNAPRMNSMKGFEAVTVLKAGSLKGAVVAISERMHDANGNHTGWIWIRGKARPFKIVDVGGFDVTDSAALPGGGMLLLERRFRWTEGVKMRIRYVSAQALRPGAKIKGHVLMEADLAQQIDNMEGIAVHEGRKGETIVTLISDDNFNRFLQRTVLLQFRLTDKALKKSGK